MRSFFNACIDLIFPRQCFNCKAYGGTFCDHCRSILESKPEWQDINGLRIYNAYIFANPMVKQCIYHAKYLGEPKLLEYMVEKIQKIDINDIDIIIPVAIHKRRLIERGFNQAEIIAKALLQSDIEVNTITLIRKRYTVSQTKISKELRSENIKDAFIIKKSLIGKRCLLVDDVVTTGSTLLACKKAIEQAGGICEKAICLARG